MSESNFISVTIDPQISSEQWRDWCLANIKKNTLLEITADSLSFNELRKFFTILNIVLVERQAKARIKGDQTWQEPPILKPYERPANITKSNQPLPQQKGL